MPYDFKTDYKDIVIKTVTLVKEQIDRTETPEID